MSDALNEGRTARPSRNQPEHVLLSIGIPTCNRAASLERTLGMIINQFNGHENTVEVVITDNSSTDSTEEVARRHAALHPYIKYYKNTTNIGVDRNFDAAVRKSAGEFVWILADDDFIEEHAIRDIVGAIRSHRDIGVIFLNYALYKDDFRTLVSSSPAQAPANGVAVDGDDFYCKTAFANSFISANVFRRQLWLNAKPDRYFDTGWIHVHVASDILTTSRAYIFIDRLVRQGWDDSRLRRRTATEYATHMNVYFEFLKFLHQLPAKGYGRQAFVLGHRLSEGDKLRQIVFLKMALNGYYFNYLLTIAARLFRYYKTSLAFWIVDLPVLFLPNSVVRSIYTFAKSYGIATRRE